MYCVVICGNTTEAVQAELGSVMVVVTLTHCAFFYFMCELKVTLINVQDSLIWEILLCEFE